MSASLLRLRFLSLKAALACAMFALPVSDALAAEPAPAKTSRELPKPTPAQVAWSDAGIGIFVHWGPQTQQNRETDDCSIPAERINPDRFDAGKLVAAAKSANAGYLVFVAKHNGGYCTWPTGTTPYSIKKSPWKNGKGDMLADMSAACREQGVKFGVYLCPADRFNKVRDKNTAEDPAKQAEADKRYRDQTTEILTHYGPLFEMWFDGGGTGKTVVDDLYDKYNPDIVQFQGKRPGGIRWVGTEHGFAPYPCWNTVNTKPGEVSNPENMDVNGAHWCPAECDVSILRPQWFWSRGSDEHVLTLDQLMEIYYLSVGRGANLLLNVAPDDHAELPPAQAARLREFGDEVNARFAKPLATTSGRGESLTLELGGEKNVDHLRLREDIAGGERVRRFRVEARLADGSWKPVAHGTQIAARQIIPFPAMRATALRLSVEESAASPVVIREFSTFFADRPVPETAYRR